MKKRSKELLILILSAVLGVVINIATASITIGDNALAVALTAIIVIASVLTVLSLDYVKPAVGVFARFLSKIVKDNEAINNLSELAIDKTSQRQGMVVIVVIGILIILLIYQLF